MFEGLYVLVYVYLGCVYFGMYVYLGYFHGCYREVITDLSIFVLSCVFGVYGNMEIKPILIFSHV